MASVAVDMAKTLERAMDSQICASDDFLSVMRQKLYSIEKITIEVSP